MEYVSCEVLTHFCCCDKQICLTVEQEFVWKNKNRTIFFGRFFCLSKLYEL